MQNGHIESFNGRFKVYDIVKVLHRKMAEKNDGRGESEHAAQFAEALNEFFTEEGIGWQFVNGQIVTRGTEAFEAVW